jgi:hypothetical protein
LTHSTAQSVLILCLSARGPLSEPLLPQRLGSFNHAANEASSCLDISLTHACLSSILGQGRGALETAVEHADQIMNVTYTTACSEGQSKVEWN